ncbi:MAG TPA: PfkB family carbohydrate kinase [Candidatus Baltobacteraceae bacterium]|jgi:D-beta-D-heptose 7-phosphate kinase/D-beta-D-heptose 1-phosphate adenosyltransferase|nr:PfkB family carbohydrate kinase [Candidatus Baltobacteraceae bacterium]
MQMQTLAPPDARALFQRMRDRRILVVGDLMVDEWIWGSVTRISPEAPVPVVAVTDHSFTLGGAGNVASNLRALSAHVDVAAAIGDDVFAATVMELLSGMEIRSTGLIRVHSRPTTRKTRVVAHSQQVVRADWESTAALDPSDSKHLCEVVRSLAATVDGVVLSDYAKGVFTSDLVDAARACPVVVADPKPQNLHLFTGVTCVAPNVLEAAEATGVRINDERSLEKAGKLLLSRLLCRYVVITRGPDGMSLFGAKGERMHMPSVARTVFDVSGAGDTVVAVLSLALAAGASIELAMQLANYAAGAVVAKLGTATAAADEILALVEHAV